MSAPGLKITNFHYSHIVFPPNQGTEFPKWIHMSGYESVIVQNAEEEAVLLARPSKSGDITVHLEPAKADAVAQPVVETFDEVMAGMASDRAALLQIAKERNIKTDGRWSLERLRETIEKAGP